MVDVSCDVRGAFEPLARATHPGQPFFLWDEDSRAARARGDLSGAGLLFCGVDILPAELPREASAHFGDALLAAGAAALARLDPSRPWTAASRALPPAIARACVAADGALAPRFAYIDAARASRAAPPHAASAAEGAEGAGSGVLVLSGHLFDFGLLGKALDLLEQVLSTFDALLLMRLRSPLLHPRRPAAAPHASAAR